MTDHQKSINQIKKEESRRVKKKTPRQDFKQDSTPFDILRKKKTEDNLNFKPKQHKIWLITKCHRLIQI